MAQAKIILFHKNSEVLKKVSKSLGSGQFSVISSSNLKYAIELAQQEKPQFLIYGDSLTAQAKKELKNLKQSDSGAEISIIAVANSEELKLFDRVEAQHYGVDDFVPDINDITEIQSRILFHLKYINQIRFINDRIDRFKKLSETTLGLMLTRGVVNICELLNDYIVSAYPLQSHLIAVDTAKSGDYDYFNASFPEQDDEPDIDKIKQDTIWYDQFISSQSINNGIIKDKKILDFLKKWGIEADTIYQFPIQPRGRNVGIIIFALQNGISIDSEEEMMIDALTKSAAQRLIEVKRIYSLERDGTKKKAEEKKYFGKPTEDEILIKLSQLIVGQLHTDICMYINYHEGFKFLYPKYSYKGDDYKNLFEREKPPVLMLKDFPIFGSVIKDKKTLVYDLSQTVGKTDLGKLPFITELSINNILTIPLIVGQSVQGFFVLGRESFLKKFSRREILESESLIKQAGAALEEDHILKQAKLNVKQLNRIFDLGSELTLDLTLDKILKKVCGAIRRTLAWNVVILDLKNQYDESFANVQILGMSEEDYDKLIKADGYPPFKSRFKTSFPISNSYFYDHKQKFSDRTVSLQQHFEVQIGTEWNDNDWIYVPITSRGNLLGVISLNDPVERTRPNEEKIKSIEYFANQAAVIIENYELIDGIKSSELKYRMLAETMTMGLVTCDPNRNIIYVNQSLSQLLKYDAPDQLIDQRLCELTTAASKPKLIKFIHDALQDKKKSAESRESAEGVEIEFVAKDGEEIPFMIYMSPYYQHGKKVGFFGVLADLRSQKKIERLKSDFNSMIVHDLRSPLNIIQGYVDIVRTEVVGSITEEQAELLTIAKENVFKVLKLIDNFLTASKLEAGHFQIELSVNSLNGLIETLWDHYQVLSNEKKIIIKKELDDALPLLNFDKFRIEQVVRNFLSNALKFTPPEGIITISSKLRKTKSQTGKDIQMFAEVVVTDTGVGIPEDELSKVFNKYEQTEAGKDASLKGTGLGLAICREIVELHDGEVWVKSKLHEGSNFGFSIPIQPLKL